MSAPSPDRAASPAARESQRRYAFGPFVLDTAERLLLRDARPVPLTPKAFDLLAFFVERAGRLVEKRELMSALWPDTVVEEANLAYTVSALRKALGEGQEGEQFIQTVPTRGYRFVARVEEARGAAVGRPRRRVRVALVTAACLVIAAMAAWLVLHRRPSREATVTRFELPLGVEMRDLAIPAISPDGRRVVFSGRKDDRRQLFVRGLNSLEVRAIPRSIGGHAFFSHDGRSIAFCDGGGFVTVDLTANVTGRIPAAGCLFMQGGHWAPDGTIYFARAVPAGLARVRAGAAPETLTTLADGDVGLGWPQLLPDGEHVLFAAKRSQELDDVDARILSLADGSVRTILNAAPRATYVATGHLVYAHGSSLLAVSFDAGSLRVTGTPIPLLDGVAVSPYVLATARPALFEISAGGTLAYHPGGILTANTSLAVHDISPSGGRPLPAPSGYYVDPALSPDGRRLAVAPSFDGQQDIWVHDFARQAWTRITTSSGFDVAPVWDPRDPDRLIYTASVPGKRSQDLYTIRADGGGSPQLLYASASYKYAGSASRAAGLVAFSESAEDGFDIWLLDVREKPRARPFLQTRFNETTPALSPDGRFLAYDSNESGDTQIYVRPISGEGKWQVSPNGGARPRWSGDGRTIVYRRMRPEGDPPAPDQMWAVTVSTTPTFVSGPPRVVFEGTFSRGGTSTANYDVTADGRQLVLVTRPAEWPRFPLVVVENWIEELRQKAAN